MTEKTITGGRCIAEMWKGYGVSHVFFVDAILRRAMVEAEELGIKRILTHSEKAAAYMADGYARVSGRPGWCMSQSVGAANLASGLQDPWLGASPVIAMTGAHPMPMQYRNAYQELDHAKLFSGVTKFHGKIETPEQLPFLIRQAFREATTGTPRPVHLDIVNHTGDMTAAASRAYDTTCETEYAVYPPHRPLPDPASITRAAAAIKAAQRPVIIPDRGAIICGAGEALAALARKIQAPICPSLDAKGHDQRGRSALVMLGRHVWLECGQSHRLRGRPDHLRRLRHRRHDDPRLAGAQARRQGDPDRHRSGRARP